jgi:uroporphyrinogen-III synthase
MAVLVTRPHPDNEATATALRGRGFEVVLAPMLRFEPFAIEEQPDAHYDGVIATSANALRAIAAHPILARLRDLPLFGVGEHTAEVARALGFRDVVVDDTVRARGAVALPDLVARYLAAAGRQNGTLCYLAGADITRDLAGELGERGFSVITHTTYRMAALSWLPEAARAAFAADRVEAILHYSRRSAGAFIDAARADGIEISALALPQCCLSDAVAMVLRDAGAPQVVVARATDEHAMLDAVDRALRPPAR